jgi:hypothetical protein
VSSFSLYSRGWISILFPEAKFCYARDPTVGGPELKTSSLWADKFLMEVVAAAARSPDTHTTQPGTRAPVCVPVCVRVCVHTRLPEHTHHTGWRPRFVPSCV